MVMYEGDIGVTFCSGFAILFLKQGLTMRIYAAMFIDGRIISVKNSE